MGILAMSGGEPVRQRDFPCWPQYDQRELEALKQCLESGLWSSVVGQRVERFQKDFAKAHDADYGIAVTNGTAALEIALRAVGVGPGDEVIVPPYTFVATATAVLQINAIPVFVDVEPVTLNLNPARIEAAITSRTRAIIPVHFIGCPCDMDRILAIAEKHDLRVVEDCAHAHGSKWKQRGVGSWGDAGTFSFQQAKNMTAGEGGIITTNDNEIAEKCWSLSNCGRQEGRPWYEHFSLAWNYRLSEFAAALLSVQLDRLDEQGRTRAENMAYLGPRLGKIPGITVIGTNDPRVSFRAHHLLMLRLHEKECGVTKPAFIKAARAEGLPVMDDYDWPVHHNPVFINKEFFAEGQNARLAFYDNLDYEKVSCPEAQRATRETIWIEHRVLLGDRSDMEDIVEIVEKVHTERSELAEVCAKVSG